MKAVSESRPRAAPVLPACGVSRRSWRGLALVNAVPWEQPRLSTPVIRWMSAKLAFKPGHLVGAGHQRLACAEAFTGRRPPTYSLTALFPNSPYSTSPDERYVAGPYARTCVVNSDRRRTTYLDVNLVGKVNEHDVSSCSSAEPLCNCGSRRRFQANPFYKASWDTEERNLAYSSKSHRKLDAHY